MATATLTCATCKRSDAELSCPFMSCSRCNDRHYCSRRCQGKDWKEGHKSRCGQSILDTMPEKSAAYYRSLVSSDFLHGIQREDVFQLLMDCYCMRRADRAAFLEHEEELKHKIVSKHTPLMEDFSKFLDIAEEHGGILPSWWSETDRDACKEEASEEGLGQESLLEHEIISEHKDFEMPMKLRLLAERIYGTCVPRSW